VRAKNLRFWSSSCFVLTESGLTLARSAALDYGPNAARQRTLRHSPAGGINGDAGPRWDCERRILWVGDYVVKQFKQPAPNQELVLRAFEEEGWPAHLDDPLPPRREMDSKKRLHDTIKRMNRNKGRMLRFQGDGSGRGLCWTLLRSPLPSPRAAPKRPRSALGVLRNAAPTLTAVFQSGAAHDSANRERRRFSSQPKEC
jgi:hypothetical protein